MAARQLIARIFAAGLVVFLIAIGFNYAIDAYDVFDTGLLPEYGEPQERYVKLRYLETGPDFDTYLLGSSRIGVIRPTDIENAIPGAHAFNMTASALSQKDTEALIHWLVTNKKNIKRVFVQVDWPEGYGDLGMIGAQPPQLGGAGRLEFLWRYLTQINFSAIGKKISNNRVHGNQFKYDKLNGSWSRPLLDSELDRDCATYVSKQLEFSLRPYQSTPAVRSAAVAAIRRYVKELQDHHIELVMFLTPHNQHYLEAVGFEDYAAFVSSIVEITPVRNFMWYSPITTDDCNYYESSHYRPRIGTLIANVVASGGQSADPYSLMMDPASLPRQLELLRANFANARSPKAQ